MSEESTPAAAPQAAPTQGEAPKTPAEPPKDPRQEYLEALDKAGGLEFKKNGKMVKMTSAQAIRALQQALPPEEALQSLKQQRQELSPKLELLQKLENGNEDEVTEALDKLLGAKFVSAAEKRLIREIQAEKKYEGMSEREKYLAQQLDAVNNEKQKAIAEKQEYEAKQRQEQEQAEVNHWRNVLGGVAVNALKSLELPEKIEPLALQLVSPIMRELMHAGQTPSPELVAQHIESTLEELMKWGFSGSRASKALSRFKAPLRAYAEAQLQAQQGAGRPNGSTPSTQPKSGDTTITPITWDPRRTIR